jgi:hypothetical protein
MTNTTGYLVVTAAFDLMACSSLLGKLNMANNGYMNKDRLTREELAQIPAMVDAGFVFDGPTQVFTPDAVSCGIADGYITEVAS